MQKRRRIRCARLRRTRIAILPGVSPATRSPLFLSIPDRQEKGGLFDALQPCRFIFQNNCATLTLASHAVPVR